MIKKFIKKIIRALDNNFKTDLYRRALKLIKAYYSSNFLNVIRRSIGPAVIKWKHKFGIKDKNPLKLHLGCGERHFQGYVNVDWRKTRATDLVCDIKKLPYLDNSVKLIESFHVIEHLPRHNLPKALKEWYRILMLGGKLVIECPDFDKDVKEYIEGNEKRLDSIFGLQRFLGDAHLFGYNFERIEILLKGIGFRDIQKKEPQDSHAKNEPCLRIECIKREKS